MEKILKKSSSIEIINKEFHKFILKRSGIINNDMANYFGDKFITAILYDKQYDQLKKYLKNVMNEKTRIIIKDNKLDFKDC